MAALLQSALVLCGVTVLSYAVFGAVALVAVRWLRAHPLHLQRALTALMARVMRLP